MTRESNPLLLSRRRALQHLAGVAVVATVPHVMSAAEPEAAPLMIDPTPRFELSPFLSMLFYRHHSGTHALTVSRTPEGLDVVASRKGNTVFLHVVNTQRSRPVRAQLQIAGHRVDRGRVIEIADEPMIEVSQLNSAAVMQSREKPLPAGAAWEFPSASVSAVELELG